MRRHLAQATEHVWIRSVLPERARLKPLKRLFLKITHVHTEPQVTFNSEIVAFGNEVVSMFEKIDTELASVGVLNDEFPDQLVAIRRELQVALAEIAASVAALRAFTTTELAALTARVVGPAATPEEQGERPRPAPPDDVDVELDALYLAFEDRFRGTVDEVQERLEVYLDPVGEVVEATAAPVVDLGCGRGEWLELLATHGIAAAGIDLNVAAVQRCRERGLDATVADAIDHLRGLPASSVSAVTAFHLVEHLPFGALVGLLDEIRRVLVPGGLVVLETPNPDNVLVGASRFWLDPTHRAPIPPDALVFLAEARGFEDVRTLFLHPRSEPVTDADTAAVRRITEYFAAAQDYSVLGTRSPS